MQINDNLINPKEWSQLLLQACSQKRGEYPRRYIVFKERNYQLLEEKNFDANTKKLSLFEITALSQKKLEEIRNDLLVILTLEKIKEFEKITSDLIRYNFRLVSSRQIKWDQPINKILRRIALVISAISSVLFFKDLSIFSQLNEEFEREMIQLKENISSLNSGLLLIKEEKFDRDFVLLTNELGYSEELAKALLTVEEIVPNLIDGLHQLNSQIDAQERDLEQLEEKYQEIRDHLQKYAFKIITAEHLHHLPFESATKFVYLEHRFANISLLFLNNQEHANTQQSNIQGTFTDHLTRYNQIEDKSKPAVLNQFKIDIPRQISFLRVDEYFGLKDVEPIPSPHSEKSISEGAGAIAQMIKRNQNDLRWSPVIQMAATQTTLNAAFGYALAFLVDISSQVIWENEENYTLSPEFPEGFPPIVIEMIRDQNTHNISSVNIKVTGQIDLIKKKKGGNYEEKVPNEKIEVIVPKAVELSFCYSVTLDDKNLPIVDNVQCEYKTALIPPFVSDIG